ncbi:MAG: pantetheine-phosphate adenylyltransferase [Acidobacteriota bacterium]
MSDPRTAAVYPGSFDPIHLGHVDIIHRALTIFPKVIVAVLENPEKKALLEMPVRVRLIKESLAGLAGVEVASFSGLLVDFLRSSGARVVLRGMRAVSDFEFEFQLSLFNRRLWADAETVFLTPNEEFVYLSSRVIREIWSFGGDISSFVPPAVHAELSRRRSSATPRE